MLYKDENYGIIMQTYINNLTHLNFKIKAGRTMEVRFIIETKFIYFLEYVSLINYS